MPNKITEYCEKCQCARIKRFVKNETNGYYSCATCLEINSKKYRKKKWEKYLAQKANSRKRPGSVILTEQDIKNLNIKQQNKCAISGVEFNIESKWDRPSLDRIDNQKGYTLDNIQLVTWIVNHTRGDLTIDEYINLCVSVGKNNA